MAKFKGKTALVTGASSGLGWELVRQLVKDRGLTVVATARRGDRLEALASEFPVGRVIPIAGDLADPTFRAELWRQAQEATNGVDVLINNAGLGDYSEFDQQSMDVVRQMLDINVMALMDLTHMAIPAMKARGSGQIIQVSSVLGFLNIPYSTVYGATKHAVNGFTQGVRYELQGTGVKVWAACPGRTQSEFSKLASKGRLKGDRGEPAEKIVRSILKGLDQRNPQFLLPSFKAAATVFLAHWLPGPFEFAMARWISQKLRRQNLELQSH